MTALFGLWLVSLALSGIALAIMIGLIVARWISNRRQDRREAERRRLVPLLLGAEPSAQEPVDVQRASNILADLATELVQMVRGTDKENFVASSSRLGVPERLRQRLDTGTARKRLAAAEALGNFVDAESVARLNAALDDPNAGVRLSAAIALAEARHAPPAGVLVEKLGIGTRENSMLIVGLFRDIAAERPEEIKALVADENAHPMVKVAAIDALAASGDYTLVPLIAELAVKADPTAEELPRYLRALGEFGHPAGAEAVGQALNSGEWWVRSTAAQAAGRMVLTGMASRLVELLGDPQWWVRFRAGEALVRLGGEGERLLRETASGGSEPAGTAARMTLAERGIAL